MLVVDSEAGQLRCSVRLLVVVVVSEGSHCWHLTGTPITGGVSEAYERLSKMSGKYFINDFSLQSNLL